MLKENYTLLLDVMDTSFVSSDVTLDGDVKASVIIIALVSTEQAHGIRTKQTTTNTDTGQR